MLLRNFPTGFEMPIPATIIPLGQQSVDNIIKMGYFICAIDCQAMLLSRRSFLSPMPATSGPHSLHCV
jgi:hypothetical protein